MSMLSLRICVDVDDVEKGIAFYGTAFGLKVGRRFRSDWVELLGGPHAVDLLWNPANTHPVPDRTLERNYDRHWTPIHLDFVVDNLEATINTCTTAGARLERPPTEKPWGRIALLSDPFGNGFCLLEFRGRGYDELTS